MECEFLGERITEWLRPRPELKVVDRLVTQSIDEQHDCFTVTGNPAAYLAEVLRVVPRASAELSETVRLSPPDGVSMVGDVYLAWESYTKSASCVFHAC
jgi:hypothetical protein